MLGSRCLYPLSHLTSPSKGFQTVTAKVVRKPFQGDSFRRILIDSVLKCVSVCGGASNVLEMLLN